MPRDETLPFSFRHGEFTLQECTDEPGHIYYFSDLGLFLDSESARSVERLAPSIASEEKRQFIATTRRWPGAPWVARIYLPIEYCAGWFFEQSFAHAERRRDPVHNEFYSWVRWWANEVPSKRSTALKEPGNWSDCASSAVEDIRIAMRGRQSAGKSSAGIEQPESQSNRDASLSLVEWEQLFALLARAQSLSENPPELLHLHRSGQPVSGPDESNSQKAVRSKAIELTQALKLELTPLLEAAKLRGHPSSQRVTPGQSLDVRPCEEFHGFVEKIEDDKAYVRLDTSRGERLCGPYPFEELASKGIGERDRFLLRAVEVGGAIRFDAQLIPRKIITPERQRQIREEIEAGLEGFTPDDER